MLLTYRKRKHSQIEKDEEEKKEVAHKKEIEEMTHTILNLKQKIDDFESVEQENESNSKKLAKLFNMGIIDEYGEPIDQSNNIS